MILEYAHFILDLNPVERKNKLKITNKSLILFIETHSPQKKNQTILG